MIRAYVENLMGLPPGAITEIALLGEAQAGRIPAAQRAELAAESRRFGCRLAQQVRAEHGEAPVGELPERYGLRVEWAHGQVDADYALFACFEPPDRVLVNLDNVQATHQLMEKEDLRQWLGAVDVGEVLLAHELYHSLEAGQPDPFPQRKVPMKGLLFGTASRRVACLEEIAAMAFAETLCGLPYSAYLLNVVMLEAGHPQRAAELYERYMDCGGLL